MADESVFSQPARPAQPARAVYVISVAAELAGMHPQTLRLYERKGLVGPTRSSGGNRRYSERDIDRLRRVQALTAAGLNLEGAKRVLQLEAEVERLHAEIDALRIEAREALDRTHRQYRRDLVPLTPRAMVWRGRGNRPRSTDGRGT
ncbi:MAG: heat shock protein transcriptional repressor HspR [Acidimicrobiales bacterium]